MKTPFWWVVRSTEGKDRRYLTSNGVWGRQGQAEPFLSSRQARGMAMLYRARPVRVWARLPKPKLPAWVQPLALNTWQIAVFEHVGKTIWEYVFHVSPMGAPSFVTAHKHICRTTASDAPMDTRRPSPDVWIEAACRAKARLRRPSPRMPDPASYRDIS